MTDDRGPEGEPLPAGGFAAWLSEVQVAIRGDGESDVACGSCTACCTSSQFVHIGPDEVDALAHIPPAVRFPAPGLPRGHVLMGYDEHGNCPMLVDGACSIYRHRPRTCRTYDCRVFPAAGLTPVDTPRIARQAERWRFDLATGDDRRRLAAVRAAAAYLGDHADELGAGRAPTSPTQRAVVAIEIHHLFLDPDDGGASAGDPPADAVRRALADLGARAGRVSSGS